MSNFGIPLEQKMHISMSNKTKASQTSSSKMKPQYFLQLYKERQDSGKEKNEENEGHPLKS
jgi:hypothetical protein